MKLGAISDGTAGTCGLYRLDTASRLCVLHEGLRLKIPSLPAAREICQAGWLGRKPSAVFTTIVATSRFRHGKYIPQKHALGLTRG